MKRNITLFPHLTKSIKKRINAFMEEFHVTYLYDGEGHELKAEVENDRGRESVYLRDDHGKWTPEFFGCKINGVLHAENLEVLFGEHGITPVNGTLGLGMQWKSKNSNARGAKKLEKFDYGSNRTAFPFEIEFEKAFLRNSVEISFVIYQVANNVSDIDLPIGTVFGEVLSLILILEGNGSVFTVFEKNEPGDALWAIECDWDDPEYSLFAESVRVTINTGHTAWQLAASDDDIRKEFIKEIMATSMQIVISELEEYQYDGSEEYEPGSVSEAISYFVSRADVNTESNASIAKTIRLYLDKAMK